MEEDRGGNAKKRQRRRRSSAASSDNPLADARRGCGAGGGGRSREQPHRQHRSPMATASEKLWFRKSGAGHRLFVEYYANQPDGVVVPAGGDDDGRDNHANSDGRKNLDDGADAVAATISNHDSTTTASVGMSRAAKRRRRRKSKSLPDRRNGASDEEEAKVATVDSTPVAPLSRQPKVHADTSSDAATYGRDDVFVSNRKLLEANSSAKHPRLRRFLAALSEPLPLCFRIRNGIKDVGTEKLLRKELEERYGHLLQKSPADDRIYQAAPGSSLSKATLSRMVPQLKKLLNARCLDGTIARQELGSMLPVFLLHRQLGRIGPGARVLDLCASPGSKTLQAAEIVGRTGRVRANDVHQGRLDALRDAVERSGIINGDVIKYTNVDATLYIPPKTEEKRYDVVICDVPCSGDGTCRKDRHILPNWSPNIAAALHETQVRILLRALECVRVGGVVSYSTCSLNPIEDEAVVGAALRGVESSSSFCRFRLVRIPHISGLLVRPGVVEWRVADYVGDDVAEEEEDDDDVPKLRWHNSFEDAVDCGMMNAVETMWRSPSRDLHLDRCMRLLPQDQNTGGFFVAFIERHS